MRLGRKAIKLDSRTLRLSNYMTGALPPPPAAKDWAGAVKMPWGMLLNDQLGDCTIAGVGHALQTFTANAGKEVAVTDADVLRYYELWDGYNPADPSTDQGGIELDVLNHWQNTYFVTETATGQNVAHKLAAFANVNPLNSTEVKQAITLFGGVYIGMQVPNFIMAGIPQLWDLPKNGNDGGIDGGHCVFCTGYNSVGVSFVSWGKLYRMTWRYWDKYVDEAHALLSMDFIKANGLDPAGFNLAQLKTDLANIK